jgi:hypothetical protein
MICSKTSRTDNARNQNSFGLGYAAALLFPWLLAAVHAFVKNFAKKFLAGATSETGKMTAAAL